MINALASPSRTSAGDNTFIPLEEFDAFVLLPENRDRNFEWHNGRIIEVVSSSLPSEIGSIILGEVRAFNKVHRLGRTTGADGGYIVNGERYIPDAAFISNARQPERVNAAYNPLTPDLAIEVISPTDNEADIREKIVNYVLAGTVLWLADPEAETIQVFVPNQKPRTLTVDDVLDGGTVLPGFQVAVRDLFPEDE